MDEFARRPAVRIASTTTVNTMSNQSRVAVATGTICKGSFTLI
jgi:hypothetical protein